MTRNDATGQEATLAPDVPVTTPSNVDELAEILAAASREETPLGIWGSGSHRQIGHLPSVQRVVSTAGLTGIVDWQPDDLTVVVRAGTPVAELEAELAAGGQSAVLPEQSGAATVGGVVATGISALARLRYGPTRDRMLQVQAVTGDGRIVQGGGRVVKNVSGYDLPRLYTGSLGSLGVITEVCFKLWPVPPAACTVEVDDVPPAGLVYRPRAVLQTQDGVRVLLSGTRAEIDDQASRLGGTVVEGLQYPAPLEGEVVWSVRVPPKRLAEAVDRLPHGSAFVAQHGVGEVSFAAPGSFDIMDLRTWAESEGGSVVKMAGESSQDPWGSPPPDLDLQRRVIAAFDPCRILEPGRLPGGL